LTERPPVDLVFLWHHHQPDYRSPHGEGALLPWVRLHATKDYLDMALRLGRHPSLRATFNFVPSLLDQLDELASGHGERLFDLIRRPVESLAAAERAEVTARCRTAPRHALERWAPYRALCRRFAPAAAGRPSVEPGDDDLVALETWFVLAWIDPLFHGEPEAIRALAASGAFTVALRDGVLALSDRLVARVVPAYRELAERGQIELSESAYYHPILPLLIDVRTGRRARPDLALPGEPFAAPADAAVQIERAFERHREAFGERPRGMWPPEGGVSPEAVTLAARAGARWLATDEAVLWRSLPPSERVREALYQPWRVDTEAGTVHLLFRDHELSDRIGFVYHHWDAAEAVGDFIGRLRKIARDHGAHGPPVVSVILDGENCWEHYSGDGGSFLDTLYGALAEAPDIRTRTPSEVIAEARAPALTDLHSGSWIDADFHIWIGHPEKNRAWELLARARRALTESGHTVESTPQAWEALFAAEGSDWFWWLGDDHETPDKGVFDRIFREHLQAAYERAGLEVPAWLLVPVARLGGDRDRITAPLGFIHPILDGRPTHFYEWHAAGRHRPGAGGSSMHRGASHVRDLYFGFDATTLFLRLDFSEAPPGADVDLWLDLLVPRAARMVVRGLAPGRPEVVGGEGEGSVPVPGAACCIATVLELAVPFEALGLAAGEAAELLVRLAHHGEAIETLPADSVLQIGVPDVSYEMSMWSV
jgi:alpha-amylase/alpha-mannosidase (GH57 family)